jgi:uncharacterized protein (TIGR00661 family)
MGNEVLFSTYKDGLEYARQEGFPVVKVPPIDFAVKPDGTVDFEQTAINPGPFLAFFTVLRQVKAEIQVIKEFKPDVVVSDSRVSTLIAAGLLGIPKISILNQFQTIIPRRTRHLKLAKLTDAGTLTIIGKIWTIGRHVLIPDFPPPYTISIGNLRIPRSYQKKIKFIGPILSKYPEELAEQTEIRKKLGLDENKPLIFSPISGPIKQRTYLTRLLMQIFNNFPRTYQIVISLGNPSGSTKPIQKRNVTIYNWVKNRFEYLKACDLVISRAGHGTLTQSICYGKPLVLIPAPSHTEQLNNSQRLAKLGIAEVVTQKDLSVHTLLESVKKILEINAFQERVKQIQAEALKLNGVETATRIITEVAQM